MGRIKRSREEINSDIATQTKICCVCNIRKSFTDFFNFKNKSDNKCYRCKACDTLARQRYNEKHSDRVRELWRNRSIKFKYGVSQEDYEAMLKRQGYCCAICKNSETRGNHSFSIDHCHASGKIRGLLCNNCNRGLGLLGDTIDSLTSAIKYLEQGN